MKYLLIILLENWPEVQATLTFEGSWMKMGARKPVTKLFADDCYLFVRYPAIDYVKRYVSLVLCTSTTYFGSLPYFLGRSSYFKLVFNVKVWCNVVLVTPS